MPPLVEVQRAFRDAMVTGKSFSGAQPERRIAIHRRHYQASLRDCLLRRFPACQWLFGTGVVESAADAYAGQYPPTDPVMALYGRGFPAFLGTVGLPAYAIDFAELEWLAGEAVLEIAGSPAGLDSLRDVPESDLDGLTLQLHPGFRYLRSAWPVDRLFQVFLADDPPAQFTMETSLVCIELAGCRGDLSVRRLTEDIYRFRSLLADGITLGDAIESVMNAHPAFDAGPALAALFHDGLVTGLRLPAQPGRTG